MGIFGLFVIYHLSSLLIRRNLLKSLLMISMACVGVFALYTQYGQTDKWLSLESRGVLMRESVTKLIEDPRHILLGHGSE